MKTIIVALGAMGHLLLRLGFFPVLVGLSGCLAAVFWALRSAPEGYEDEQGFHFKQARRAVSGPTGVTMLRPHKVGGVISF